MFTLLVLRLGKEEAEVKKKGVMRVNLLEGSCGFSWCCFAAREKTESTSPFPPGEQPQKSPSTWYGEAGSLLGQCAGFWFGFFFF